MELPNFLSSRRTSHVVFDRGRNNRTLNGFDAVADPPHRLPPTRVQPAPSLEMDQASDETKTIIWATSYRPDYSWLEVPVVDRKGRLQHDGGVVSSPGMYLMGTQFMRRRKSALIDGAGDDARDLSAHLTSYLDSRLARIRA
jgi:putative flavoprotein involved in K+ transport